MIMGTCSKSWWRHQMETFSALLPISSGNSPVPGEFPAQRPVTRSFDVFFDLHPNKRLSKQLWGWFETSSRLLWRHCNIVLGFLTAWLFNVLHYFGLSHMGILLKCPILGCGSLCRILFQQFPGDPSYLHGLSLIPAGINNYIQYKVWGEITYPFSNFNGANRWSLGMDK